MQMRILRNKFAMIVLLNEGCETKSMTISTRVPAMPNAKIHVNLSAYSAPDRLTWMVELMSRYAAEKADSHECPRLAAAIVTHLKAFLGDLPTHEQLADTVSHWLDIWEPLMERHVASTRATAGHPVTDTSNALTALVTRARYA